MVTAESAAKNFGLLETFMRDLNAMQFCRNPKFRGLANNPS